MRTLLRVWDRDRVLHSELRQHSDFRNFRGSIACLHVPLSTLRVHPCDCPRMTQGQDGSLSLTCVTLTFTTPRRFIPAHFHNTPSLVPTGPRQARHPRHVTFLQGVNEPAFHPQAKLRSRTRPTGSYLTNSMLPALHPRQAAVQKGSAIAAIQMPPHAFLGMVVHRRALATLWTRPPCAGRLLDPDVNPLSRHIQSHFSHHPGSTQPQQGGVQLGIFHLGLLSPSRMPKDNTGVSHPMIGKGKTLHLGATHSKPGTAIFISARMLSVASQYQISS